MLGVIFILYKIDLKYHLKNNELHEVGFNMFVRIGSSKKVKEKVKTIVQKECQKALEKIKMAKGEEDIVCRVVIYPIIPYFGKEVMYWYQVQKGEVLKDETKDMTFSELFLTFPYYFILFMIIYLLLKKFDVHIPYIM